MILANTTKQVTPMGSASFPGLPPSTVVIEDARTVLVDLSGDGDVDIVHDRQTGRTLVLAPLHAPSVPRSTFKPGAVFHHEPTPEGLEVNVKQDTGRMVSESRHAITAAQEERAEVCHAASLIGLCSLGSVCSRMDFNAAGRL